MGPTIPPEHYLRAFNNADNRGVFVIEDASKGFYVEPWPDRASAEFGGCEIGGRLGGILRTKGEPVSMRKMYEEHGEHIAAAAEHFFLPESWLAGMCAIEAVPGHGMRWDSRSTREEPGFVSDEETPHRVSAGPMQTLLSTAEEMRRKHFRGWPAIRSRGQLYDALTSFMLGAAYMQKQVDRYGMRPAEVCGGYNAGSARSSTENEFGVRTYGGTRVIKFLAYTNDYNAVLAEVRG